MIEQLLGQVVTSGVFLGAVAYLAKGLVTAQLNKAQEDYKNQLSKSLEQFKDQLATEREQSLAAFKASSDTWHTYRAKAHLDLWEQLVQSKWMFGELASVYMISLQADDIIKRAQITSWEACKFVEQRKLVLAPELYQRVHHIIMDLHGRTRSLCMQVFAAGDLSKSPNALKIKSVCDASFRFVEDELSKDLESLLPEIATAALKGAHTSRN